MLRHELWRTGRMLVAGLLLGGAGAVGAGRLLQSLIFEVQPNDPALLLSVGAVLTVVGLLAAYVPARRGTAVDPVRCLRV